VELRHQRVDAVAEVEAGLLAGGEEPLDQAVPHRRAHRHIERVDRRPRRLLGRVLLVAQPGRLVLVPHGAERGAEGVVVDDVAGVRVLDGPRPDAVRALVGIGSGRSCSSSRT
jgi:hypothetical protein